MFLRVTFVVCHGGSYCVLDSVLASWCFVVLF